MSPITRMSDKRSRRLSSEHEPSVAGSNEDTEATQSLEKGSSGADGSILVRLRKDQESNMGSDEDRPQGTEPKF